MMTNNEYHHCLLTSTWVLMLHDHITTPHLMVVERWQTTSTYTSLLDFSYFGGNISLVGWCMGQILNLTRTFRVMRNCASEWRSYPSQSWSCCGSSLISHSSSWRDLCIAAWRFKSDLMVVLCCTFALAWCRFRQWWEFLFLYSRTSRRSAIIRHDSGRLRISKTFLAGHSQSV